MPRDNPLAEQPFAYRADREGRVRISYRGRVVTTLSGAAAQRFLARVESSGDAEAQLAMARATGQFKRGNEKQAKRARDER